MSSPAPVCAAAAEAGHTMLVPLPGLMGDASGCCTRISMPWASSAGEALRRSVKTGWRVRDVEAERSRNCVCGCCCPLCLSAVILGEACEDNRGVLRGPVWRLVWSTPPPLLRRAKAGPPSPAATIAVVEDADECDSASRALTMPGVVGSCSPLGVGAQLAFAHCPPPELLPRCERGVSTSTTVMCASTSECGDMRPAITVVVGAAASEGPAAKEAAAPSDMAAALGRTAGDPGNDGSCSC